MVPLPSLKGIFMQKFFLPLFFVTSLGASGFSVNPSFQGYSGLINTPNAQVTKEGHATLMYNNQFDNNLVSYDYDKQHSGQDDYIVGFGLFSFMEVQGRLSEAPGYHRDLSANIKLQLPYHHKYLPDLAIGIQDIGGAANYYDNQYIVLDKELWFLRASIGYGHASVEREHLKRMDGLFYALEVKAADWLYLMGEDDSKEQQLAIRLQMPKEWIKAFNLRATIAQNITSNETNFAFSVDIPLYHQSKQEKIAIQNKVTQEQNSLYLKKSKKDTTKITKNYKNISPEPISADKKIKTVLDLENKLIDFGFENVRAIKKADTIYVEFENTIFDHTDLDAIGYLLGSMAQSDIEFKNYKIILLKNRIQTVAISGKIDKFKAYLKTNALVDERALRRDMRISRSFDDSKVGFLDYKNSSLFIPRVEFSLGLITTVGTEVGVLDYLASLKTMAYMNLYDGLVISAMYETPFANSDDFDKGGNFYNEYETYTKNRLVSAMVHQTLHWENLLNTTSVGKYKTDYVGVMNQTDYTTTSGEHAFRLNVGYFGYEKNDYAIRDYYLATYRYNYSDLDLYLSATYGKFWNQDDGAELQLKRFFGETSVAFNYKNTSYKQYTEEFAGIEVSFPLTTRKLFKANYIQLKGQKDFTHSIKSTINKDDGTNTLNHYSAEIPEPDFKIATEYLNRDRLSSSYIKNHLDRVREAYMTYKDK
jgi:hypothetical protein